MATCKGCDRYASQGKDLCPFCQIRWGDCHVKGVLTKDLQPAPKPEETQIGFDLGENSEKTVNSSTNKEVHR